MNNSSRLSQSADSLARSGLFQEDVESNYRKAEALRKRLLLENDTLRRRNKELESKLAEKDMVITDCTKKISALEKDITNLQDTEKRQSTEIDILKTHVKNLEDDNDLLRAENERLKTKNKELAEEVKKLVENNEILVENNEILNEDMRQAQGDIKELKKIVGRLSALSKQLTLGDRALDERAYINRFENFILRHFPLSNERTGLGDLVDAWRDDSSEYLLKDGRDINSLEIPFKLAHISKLRLVLRTRKKDGNEYAHGDRPNDKEVANELFALIRRDMAKFQKKDQSIGEFLDFLDENKNKI